jgi:hypothetical protein
MIRAGEVSDVAKTDVITKLLTRVRFAVSLPSLPVSAETDSISCTYMHCLHVRFHHRSAHPLRLQTILRCEKEI